MKKDPTKAGQALSEKSSDTKTGISIVLLNIVNNKPRTR
jgi:hypothetical protein